MDYVRVLRVLEYVGPRNQVEEQVRRSIHGSRVFCDVVVRAATVGDFPEILEGGVKDAEGYEA